MKWRFYYNIILKSLYCDQIIKQTIAMDKNIVGTNAGKIWCALKEVGEISIPELARRLNLSVESTALAAGWLARENKICIQRKNGLLVLSDENTFPFSFG